MAASKPRIKLPDVIRPGEIIEIKALITHVMETGNRKDRDGTPIPRNIIHTFTAHFDGTEVFRAELGPGISANPYLAFFLKIAGPGDLTVSWHDDDGDETVEIHPVRVV